MDAPPPPPPPLPPPPRSSVSAAPTPRAAERPMAPEADAPAKRLMTSGIVVLGAAVGSGALTYFTNDTRLKTETTLKTTEQTNAVLIASGLLPQDTSELEQKIKLNRTLSVSFGISTAVLLVTGGALFLAGYGRAQRAKAITWAPRLTGLEVSF
jgi:hypothetical protein